MEAVAVPWTGMEPGAWAVPFGSQVGDLAGDLAGEAGDLAGLAEDLAGLAVECPAEPVEAGD